MHLARNRRSLKAGKRLEPVSEKLAQKKPTKSHSKAAS